MNARLNGCVFAANPDNRSSTSSFMFFLGGGPISFGAKTQTPIFQSTVEAEMMALSDEVKEVVYLNNLLGEQGFESFNTVRVNCDRIGAMSVIANRSYSSRTKHVALRLFFIHELASSGKITLHHVPTGAMLANVGANHGSNGAFRLIMQQIKDRFPLSTTVILFPGFSLFLFGLCAGMSSEWHRGNARAKHVYLKKYQPRRHARLHPKIPLRSLSAPRIVVLGILGLAQGLLWQ